MTSSPYFDNICTLPLSSDLFCQILHPKLPIVTVGLASGHVQSYRLPDAAESEDTQAPPPAILPTLNGTSSILSTRRRSSTASENGLGSVETLWKTRRHKCSCRCLASSYDGQLGYSAGTDGLVKCFEAETGRVVSKIAIPQSSSGSDTSDDTDGPTVLHALTPQTLILGTDSGKVYLHDLRQGGREMLGKPSQSWSPHGNEHVNALVPLPASETSTSGFPKSWVSVGGTTLAVTDIRKGVVATSEDQEVELTSVAIVQGLKKGGTSVGEKVLVGQSDGVVSLWEKGVWGDLDERIVVDRMGGASVDSIAELPTSWTMGKGKGKLKMNEKMVVVGLEDGRMKFLRIGRNGVIEEWDLRHDEIDGVVGLGYDAEGDRMVSGGGQMVKVWTEAKGEAANLNGVAKRSRQDSNEDIDDENGSNAEVDQDSDSEDEERNTDKRRKRKRNRGKDKSGGKALSFTGIF